MPLFRQRQRVYRVEVRFPLIAAAPSGDLYTLLINGTVWHTATGRGGQAEPIGVSDLATDLTKFKALYDLPPADERPLGPLSPEDAAWGAFLFDLTAMLQAARGLAHRPTAPRNRQ